MKILGLHVHHNASVCLFDGADLIFYQQEERLSRHKHAGGYPIHSLVELKKITDHLDVVLISGYNLDYDSSVSVIGYLHNMGFKIEEWFYYFKSHHLSHAFKAFCSSKFSESLVVVWDGRGSNYNLSDGSVAYETTSIFHMSYENGVKLVSKRLYRPNSEHDDVNDLKVIYRSEDYFNNFTSPIKLHEEYYEKILLKAPDIGKFYETVVGHLGFNSITDCGKLMGLHPYGKENKVVHDLIYDDIINEFKCDILSPDIEKINVNVEKYKFLETKKENKENLFDLAYETQKGLEKTGFNIIKKVLDKNISKNLVLSGGISLNIVSNSYYRKSIPDDINLYVEPLCGDEGNSIGITQFYMYDKLKVRPNATDSIYLCGNAPVYNLNLHVSEQIYHDVEYSFIVDLLLQGNIVSIFQGKSESGPRALGNRSLLFDPRIKNGKDIVNKIKKREKFRPFACSVLLEESHKWFDMTLIKESPYMMYSFDALPGVKDIIPSVIHVDNTSRIQTVTENQNYHYYHLIKEFFRQTNVPILFNTSFNLAGDPIVETIEDALNTLRKSELEYLYLPEISKLIYIKNK